VSRQGPTIHKVKLIFYFPAQLQPPSPAAPKSLDMRSTLEGISFIVHFLERTKKSTASQVLKTNPKMFSPCPGCHETLFVLREVFTSGAPTTGNVGRNGPMTSPPSAKMSHFGGAFFFVVGDPGPSHRAESLRNFL
jgi:hypothetical protein